MLNTLNLDKDFWIVLLPITPKSRLQKKLVLILMSKELINNHEKPELSDSLARNQRWLHQSHMNLSFKFSVPAGNKWIHKKNYFPFGNSGHFLEKILSKTLSDNFVITYIYSIKLFIEREQGFNF